MKLQEKRSAAYISTARHHEELPVQYQVNWRKETQNKWLAKHEYSDKNEQARTSTVRTARV
jgi:hypothetical protein